MTEAGRAVDVDVIIVGASLSAAAAAKRLVDAGLETVVLERKKLPRHKICSGILSPRGHRFLLENFGPLPRSVLHEPTSCRGVTFHFPSMRRLSMDFLSGPTPHLYRKQSDYWAIRRSGTEVHDETVKEVLDLTDHRVLLAIVEACIEGNAAAALEACNRANAAGVEPKRLSSDLVHLLRDMVVLRIAPGATELVEGSDDELSALRALASQADPTRLRRMFRVLVKEQEDLAWAPQPFAVLEMALDVDLLSSLSGGASGTHRPSGSCRRAKIEDGEENSIHPFGATSQRVFPCCSRP